MRGPAGHRASLLLLQSAVHTWECKFNSVQRRNQELIFSLKTWDRNDTFKVALWLGHASKKLKETDFGWLFSVQRTSNPGLQRKTVCLDVWHWIFLPVLQRMQNGGSNSLYRKIWACNLVLGAFIWNDRDLYYFSFKITFFALPWRFHLNGSISAHNTLNLFCSVTQL